MNIIKFIITTALMVSTFTFASVTGWEIGDPKTGGNFQLRSGTSFVHDYEVASTYTKSRFIIPTKYVSAEVSSYITNGTIDKMALRLGILDNIGLAVESDGGEIQYGIQMYNTYMILGVPTQFAIEENYSTNTEDFGSVVEIDWFFNSFMLIASTSFDYVGNWSPYFGTVYHLTNNVDVGFGGWWSMTDSDCNVWGYSTDVTIKF